jgi:bacillithiol system protein YtxJ
VGIEGEKRQFMAMEHVIDESKLETVFKAKLAVLFKHSTICGVSAVAMDEMRDFAEKHPDVPVSVVDVLAHRPLSQKVATYLGIEHQSPQIIVIRDGAAAWNCSHYEITARRVAEALDSA